MSSRRVITGTIVLVGLVAAASFVTVVQAQGQPPAASAAVPRQRISVTKHEGSMFVSLTAENALLSEVAAELSRRTGVPFTVSGDVASERVWAGFVDAPFEQAVGRLTRRVYVDYELRPDAASQPVLVQFLGPEVPLGAPSGAGSGVLITGNTEDPASLKDALKIALDFNRLTIVVGRQPLGDVLASAAETLGVPFIADDPGKQLITASVSDRPEFALLKLAPNVRVRVRADLYKNERTVQRIQLVVP
jgi:hypothetical protein